MHLLMYMFIRFTKSNFTPQQILEYMEEALESPHKRIKRYLFSCKHYVPSRLVFVGRDNLKHGLRRLSVMFKDLYEDEDDNAELIKSAHIRMNVERGGGEAFQNILRELIQSSDDQWTSEGPSALIPLPLSQPRDFARQLNRYARAADVLPVFNFAEELQRDPVYSIRCSARPSHEVTTCRTGQDSNGNGN
jgi:hypothetical protein